MLRIEDRLSAVSVAVRFGVPPVRPGAGSNPFANNLVLKWSIIDMPHAR
jgi:hypothetical protein